MTTAPMVINASHSVNASNGLPALGQYIRRYSLMAMAQCYDTSGANDDVGVVVEYGIEGGHVKNAC